MQHFFVLGMLKCDSLVEQLTRSALLLMHWCNSSFFLLHILWFVTWPFTLQCIISPASAPNIMCYKYIACNWTSLCVFCCKPIASWHGHTLCIKKTDYHNYTIIMTHVQIADGSEECGASTISPLCTAIYHCPCSHHLDNRVIACFANTCHNFQSVWIFFCIICMWKRAS